MRAMRLERPGPVGSAPLNPIDGADPEPGPDEVLIDVSACAVCRTDLQITEGDLVARRLPIVPGHQIVGTVRSAGRDADSSLIGRRVGVAWIASTCGVCRFCRSGRENLCEQARFTGWDVDGGYASTAVARGDFVYPIDPPAGVDDVEVAPLLCGGAIGYRSLGVSGIEPGGRLGLFGFGASALCAIQVAVHWGCEVYVATRSASEQERARALGAVWAGGYDERPPAPLDAAITFAPVGDVVIAALDAIDRGGTVAINAIHLDHIPEFDYDALWWERSLRSVANVTRADVSELLDLARTIPIRTTVEPFALDDANVALERLAGGQVGGSAVLDVGAAGPR